MQFSQIWSNMEMSNNAAKYEVLIKQDLRSVLDVSDKHLQMDLQITEPWTSVWKVYYRYFRSEITRESKKKTYVSQSGEVIFP